jgi:hypothetical protein
MGPTPVLYGVLYAVLDTLQYLGLVLVMTWEIEGRMVDATTGTPRSRGSLSREKIIREACSKSTAPAP